MGEIERVIPQGPNRHCGKLEQHDKHPNYIPVQGTIPATDGVTIDGSWCDGVPPLEAFAELTIRVPLSKGGVAATSHEAAFKLVQAAGLSLFVNYLDHPKTALVMRIRTADGQDRVYPVIRNKDGKGFRAVVMPDE